MKIDDRVYELISGKLDDRLSPMEETELSDWLAEDVKHEKIYAEIKKIRDQVKLLHRDFTPDWKSHSTLTLLATQDLPTFLYYMIDPLKSWCWGAILFYPFKNSRFS